MTLTATRVGIVLSIVMALGCASLSAQSSSAGTVLGIITDPSAAAIAGASVELTNPISSYAQKTTSDAQGKYHFNNVPPNTYSVTASAPNFTPTKQQVTVRSAVPVEANLNLKLGVSQSNVTVVGEGNALLETVPYDHNDVDKALYSKLPISSPATGLSDAVTMSTAGVSADANGFFHPLGDHAQVTFSIDGQPVSDQQSKTFSTQMPLNAIQSMELITGTPTAEYGDKTSLIVNAVTQSGLGKKPFGAFAAHYGSFGNVGEESSFGMGSAAAGNFVVINVERSGRFLDSPESTAFHDIGNNGSFFDRLDYNPSGRDALHLNLFLARNWFQVPNSYDQLGQDQKQRVMTFSIAPGYQRTFSSHALLTVNTFVRRDQVNYYASRNPFADTPVTESQTRFLTNYGVRADLSYAVGAHDFKLGTELKQTRLAESFQLGITDPGFNAACLGASGAPVTDPGLTDPARCTGLGFTTNPDFAPSLVPIDLSRGGAPFRFHNTGKINQYSFYLQDTINFGNWNLTPGLRFDQYNGLSSTTSAQPRLGAAYKIKRTNTVLRGGYARTLETPFNENLLLSSALGSGGLASGVFGSQVSVPLKSGNRNQFNLGFQQSLGKYVLLDADYFWKYTDNAYDFAVLFLTPIAFPISWSKSKLDGFSARVSTTDIHGFQAYMTVGHTRARYFPPENGGLISGVAPGGSVFRIDHDQAFQQNTNLRYQRPRNGEWISFTWRYDSGLVAGAVGHVDDVLGLTAAQQTTIGFFCGTQRATFSAPITSCDTQNYGASLVKIPARGTQNDDHNPGRVQSRNVFNLGVGTDNLFHKEGKRTTLKFTVANLTNTRALYNFLSTFSGTHFVEPRSYTAEIGFVF